MRVEVDGLAKVLAAPRRAEVRLVGNVPRIIQGHVQEAVDNERRSHKYQNRSGDAEKGTRARATTNGATAEMDVPYAGYLNAGGWSEFDVWMERADFEILEALDDLADEI